MTHSPTLSLPHVYLHTLPQTYIHTPIHPHIHTHMYSHIFTQCKLTLIHIHTVMLMMSHAWSFSHIYAHTHTLMLAHSLSYCYTRHTVTHTDTQSHSWNSPSNTFTLTLQTHTPSFLHRAPPFGDDNRTPCCLRANALDRSCLSLSAASALTCLSTGWHLGCSGPSLPICDSGQLWGTKQSHFVLHIT